jgi:hypothetical protein
MAEAQWNISMRERDRAAVLAWQKRASRVLGREVTVKDAVLLAVELAESLPDAEVKRGYA